MYNNPYIEYRRKVKKKLIFLGVMLIGLPSFVAYMAYRLSSSNKEQPFDPNDIGSIPISSSQEFQECYSLKYGKFVDWGHILHQSDRIFYAEITVAKKNNFSCSLTSARHANLLVKDKNGCIGGIKGCIGGIKGLFLFFQSMKPFFLG